jgi:CubicO group peptidase (beta-lactamase class C family)
MSAFENRMIKTERCQPWEYERKGQELRNLSSRALEKLEALRSTSFLVIKDEKIWYEKYWHPNTQHTVTNSFSVAKSIVATLVGIAVGDGLLKIDDPVAKFLDSFKKGGKENITIEHLLRMTSGLRWVESEGGALSHNAEAYYGESLDTLINNLEVRRPPGEVYRYASGNTQVLAMILAQVTKMNLSQYASLKLWSVVGAEDHAYWNLDRKDGREKAFCCFYATARDFAKIGQLYLNNGNWQGRSIVPESFIQQSTQAKAIPDIWLNQTNKIYGMHWWLAQHAGYDFFYARGIRGQYIICNRELKLIIVRLGHRRNPVDRHNGHPPDLFDHINAGLEIIMSSPTLAP